MSSSRSSGAADEATGFKAGTLRLGDADGHCLQLRHFRRFHELLDGGFLTGRRDAADQREGSEQRR
jgi:hypothetical protein